MIQPPDGAAHGLDDLGMAMTQNCAHLSGGEIQHAAVLRVVQEGTFGANRHEGREIASKSQHVTTRPTPERIIRFGKNLIHRRFRVAAQVYATLSNRST